MANNNDQLKQEIMNLLTKKISEGNMDTSKDEVDRLTSKLSDTDKKRLNEILNDPQKQQELLSSPLAQKFIKKFSGGK